MKPVTQRDIAEALGLSQTTVALVVGRNSNHRGLAKLSRETVARIQEKALELGYRPNRHAQVMRKGRSMQIGVIYSSTQLQVANERAHHINSAISAAGYEPVFFDETCHQKGLKQAFEVMVDIRVAGVILASTGHLLDPSIPVNELPIPLVGISATDVGDHRLVRCDMRDGMLRTFRHLVDQGCRRIVSILPFRSPETYGKWRWQQQMQAEGVEQGAREQGGEFSVLSLEHYADWAGKAAEKKGLLTALTLCTTPEIDRVNTRWQPHFSGVAVAQALLKSGAPLPDAIMCPNDDWAFGLTCEMMRAGIRIPRDIAITGFNDSALCEVFTVPLTTVRQPTEEICRLAINLLSDEINGTPPAGECHDIKGELLVRDSSRFGNDPAFRQNTLERSHNARSANALS